MSQRGFRLSTNSSQGLAKADISETSSINHHSLLRAVMRSTDREKLNIAYLKDLSKLPDAECNPAEMNEAIQSLVRYVKEQEVFGTGTSHTLSKSNSIASKAFGEHKEIRAHRDHLVKEQEYLREEILGLAERLKSLEALRDCLGLEEDGLAETTGRKRWKKFQMNKLKNQNKTVQEALIEMGLKEKMTTDKKAGMNDMEVQQRHLELIQAQAKSIEELNKFELLQLKKPKHKEPHESNEMKMLKKVTRKINLLYAKINDVDMETKAYQKSFGAKQRQLSLANQTLADQIRELVEKVNRAKTYHAFTEMDVPYADAKEFLESNPVPYNFSSVIKDYKLMDVLQ